MRKAIAGSGLPTDHSLVQEAILLLKQWEGQNLALRAEARLAKATNRAAKGYKDKEPEAGDLLGSAIADLTQQGVDARYLEKARNTLISWQEARLKRAKKDLSIAMEYTDQAFLREALSLAEKAGVEKAMLAAGTRLLQKLAWEEELNKFLVAAMESGDLLQLEKAAQRAHSKFFLEEENECLLCGVLETTLRYWTAELANALLSKGVEGLAKDVKTCEALLLRSKNDLAEMNDKEEVNEVCVRTLERDIRGLELVMPKARDLAAVHTAELELKRVLGAVERYAADLPEVIKSTEAITVDRVS